MNLEKINEEKKEKKIKVSKCWFCKIECKLDSLIRVEIGNKNKLMKYAHEECYENYLDKKKFYIDLKEILNIPIVDKSIIIILDQISKQGYNWKCFNMVLDVKKDAIVKNFNKGWRYTIGIIKSELPIAFREIEEKKRNKINQQYNIENNNFPQEEMPEEYKQKERLDISNLLD